MADDHTQQCFNKTVKVTIVVVGFFFHKLQLLRLSINLMCYEVHYCNCGGVSFNARVKLIQMPFCISTKTISTEE